MHHSAKISLKWDISPGWDDFSHMSSFLKHFGIDIFYGIRSFFLWGKWFDFYIISCNYHLLYGGEYVSLIMFLLQHIDFTQTNFQRT